MSSNIYWLSNEEYGNQCKEKLVNLYDEFFNCKDAKTKEKLLKQIEVYLYVVCEIIAYRKLVKTYSSLFHKLHFTVEDYIDYKAKRLLLTIKNKEEYIEDILNYIYMSFMLSSPALIYDFGEKMGCCKANRKTQPYYQAVRDKFFFNESVPIEHIVFAVDSCFSTNDTDDIKTKTKLDKYAYDKWKKDIYNYSCSTNDILIKQIAKLSNSNNCSEKSSEYLTDILLNWSTKIEDEYQDVKQKKFAQSNNYSLIDYITYKYEEGKTNLSYSEFCDVLVILQSLKMGK